MDDSVSANNLTTATTGYLLDARQGKVLKDMIEQNNSLVGIVVNVLSDGRVNISEVEYNKFSEAKRQGKPILFVGRNNGGYFTYLIPILQLNSGPTEIEYTCICFMGKQGDNSIPMAHIKLTLDVFSYSPNDIGTFKDFKNIEFTSDGNGIKFLSDDGTYKSIDIPKENDNLKIIKIYQRFDDSPSVLMDYWYITPEKNSKLFSYIENKQSIIFAIYKYEDQDNKYNEFLEYLLIENIDITDTNLSAICNKTIVENNAVALRKLDIGPFTKDISSDDRIGSPEQSNSSFILSKSGDGTKYLNDKGEYKEISVGGESDVQFVDIEARYQSMGGVYEWLLENITFEQVEAAINANKLIVIRYKGYKFISTNNTKLLNSDQTLKGYNFFTISQDSSNAVDDGSGNYTFKNDGIPVYAKVVTILTTGYVWFDGVQYDGNLHLPIDLTFKVKGDGGKFLNDKGEYKEIANPPVLATVTNDFPLWEDGISYRGLITSELEVPDEDKLRYSVLNDIPFLINMVYTVNGAVFTMHRDITFISSGNKIITFRSFLTQGKTNFDVQIWLYFNPTTGNVNKTNVMVRVTKMSDHTFNNMTLESPEIVDKLKNIVVYTETAGTEGQILMIKDGKPTWVDKSELNS